MHTGTAVAAATTAQAIVQHSARDGIETPGDELLDDLIAVKALVKAVIARLARAGCVWRE